MPDVRSQQKLERIRYKERRSSRFYHGLFRPSGAFFRLQFSADYTITTFGFDFRHGQAFCDPKMTGCSSIRSQLICDELIWDKAIFLQKLAHEFQRGTLVPFRLDQHIEDLALGVDGSPEIDHGHRFSDRPRRDARWCGASACVYAS